MRQGTVWLGRVEPAALKRRPRVPVFLTGPFPQRISVAAIPTGESWFLPNIPGSWSAELIPHRRLAPEEEIESGRRRPGVRSFLSGAYPQQVSLSTTAIRSGEAWPTPVVAGPITVSPIPSGESWPTASVNVIITITFAAGAAIKTAENWPAVTVALAKTVTFPAGAAIKTGESWPTPTVRGSIQYVNVIPIASGETWKFPTVTGGRQGTFLFIGGVDFSAYLASRQGVATIQSQTIGRWKATFDLVDPLGTLNPQLGQTVLITDFGRREFAGCIQEVIWERALGTQGPNPATRWHITATDKSSICDHRVVTGRTYAAGTDVAQVILDILANYLNGEGITSQGVPQDGTLGVLGAAVPFNFPTVTQAFDQIAIITGTVWWIDVNGVLNFSSLANLPVAPFSLSEISNNFRGQQQNGLTTTRTTTNYFNKLYAVSNLNILPGSGSGGGSGAGGGQSETFDFAVGSPGIRVNTDAFGVQFAAAIITSVGIGAVISMTVNGATQSVYDFAQWAGQGSTGATDHLWFFTQGANSVVWTLGPIPNHAVVVITYVPLLSLSASLAQYGVALSPTNPAGATLGTCGSGVYEGVIQVKDISSQSDLNAIASSELQRIGGIPGIVNFQTDSPGLAPGQLLTVNVPLSGIPIPQALGTQLLITSIRGVHQGAQMPGGSSFFWDVTATTQLDPGNWVKWYERLIGRTQNALPVLQYEEGTFVLGSGSTLSSGVNLANPYIVGRTGLFTEILLAAATPPVGQTLVLSITRNGVAIATVTMPSGTLANAVLVTAVPRANQIYLFAHDALNCNATYQATGGGTVQASGVTLKLRWAM